MSLYAFFRPVPFVLGKQPTRVSVLPAALASLAEKLMKDYERIGHWISLHVRPLPTGWGAPKHAQFNFVKVAQKFLQKDSNIYSKEGNTMP
jgi:hypothetical protein